MNIYVTGIGEKSGKTVICAGIAAVMQSLGYNSGVYKPVQTGALDREKFLLSPDLSFVKLIDPYITTHSSFMFKTHAMPVLCTKTERLKISLENISGDYEILKQKTDTLLVEAHSGLMTPLYDDVFNYAIPKTLDLPVLFVVNAKPGSLNNYLNELNTAQSFGLNVLGTVINNFPVFSHDLEIKSFPDLIEKYSDVKVLGLIRNINENPPSANSLINEILNGINLQDVLNMKIPKLEI